MQNCIAKLFSAVLNSRLVSFYEDKFADQQFGFRTNHRTTDSIFILKSLITKISCKREKKNICIFVELLTLFGTMDYLYKLMENGIGLNIFTVIKTCIRAVNQQ